MQEFRKKDILVVSIVIWIVLFSIFFTYKLSIADTLCSNGLEVDEYSIELECKVNFTEYQQIASTNNSFCPEGKNHYKIYGGCEKQYFNSIKRMLIPFIIWLIPVAIIFLIHKKEFDNYKNR